MMWFGLNIILVCLVIIQSTSAVVNSDNGVKLGTSDQDGGAISVSNLQKSGDCPEPDLDDSIVCEPIDRCGGDGDCDGTAKCCPDQCGTFCIPPRQDDEPPASQHGEKLFKKICDVEKNIKQLREKFNGIKEEMVEKELSDELQKMLEKLDQALSSLERKIAEIKDKWFHNPQSICSRSGFLKLLDLVSKISDATSALSELMKNLKGKKFKKCKKALNKVLKGLNQNRKTIVKCHSEFVSKPVGGIKIPPAFGDSEEIKRMKTKYNKIVSELSEIFKKFNKLAGSKLFSKYQDLISKLWEALHEWLRKFTEFEKLLYIKGDKKKAEMDQWLEKLKELKEAINAAVTELKEKAVDDKPGKKAKICKLVDPIIECLEDLCEKISDMVNGIDDFKKKK